MRRFLFIQVFLCLSFCVRASGSTGSRLKSDTTFTLLFQQHPVFFIVKFPENEIKGNLLLLHGWNLPPEEWCEKTSFCKTALDSGFVLILPDFGKTTYHFEQYPETIEKYRKYPTRKWMYDTALVHLQNVFGLLKAGDNNFVAGISTGGRGAALFALEHPGIFRASAALSADFDQSKIADEPINNGYYGAYKKFPKRWNGPDNIYNRASEMKVPLFIAHGKSDKVCPFSQSEMYVAQLKKIQPGLTVEFYAPASAGHTYDFWQMCSQRMILFFLSR